MYFRQFAIAPFACAILLLPALPAPADGAADAQALLAKHRAYVGWQIGDGTFKTMRLSGTYKDQKGETRALITTTSVSLAYRTTYRYPKRANVTDDSGFTGTIFWLTDYNGFTTPVYGGLAKYRLAQQALFAEATSALPATSQGAATVEGKAVQVVRVQLPRADAIDVYVDASTGAYVQAVIDPGGTYETTIHILRYDDVVPGKKIVASYSVGQSKASYEWTKIEPNVVVSEADLHPPAPTATWNFANPAPFPLTVTNDRLLIDATVNGVLGHFILDTGSDGIALNEAFATRAKVALLHEGEAARPELVKKQHFNILGTTAYARGVGGVEAVSCGNLQTLAIGPIVYAGEKACESRSFDGDDILVGFDFLKHFDIVMDYPNAAIVLDPIVDK